MFTGSTAVGRKVAAQAGEHLIDCSMELGGKNSLLVLARLEAGTVNVPRWNEPGTLRPGGIAGAARSQSVPGIK